MIDQTELDRLRKFAEFDTTLGLGREARAAIPMLIAEIERLRELAYTRDIFDPTKLSDVTWKALADAHEETALELAQAHAVASFELEATKADLSAARAEDAAYLDSFDDYGCDADD